MRLRPWVCHWLVKFRAHAASLSVLSIYLIRIACLWSLYEHIIHMTSCTKPEVGYITYSIVVRGGPSHGHGQTYTVATQKFAEVWTWMLRYASKQTDRQRDRQTNTLIAVLHTSSGRRRRSSFNFGQDIFARKFMSEKLIKCAAKTGFEIQSYIPHRPTDEMKNRILSKIKGACSSFFQNISTARRKIFLGKRHVITWRLPKKYFFSRIGGCTVCRLRNTFTTF